MLSCCACSASKCSCERRDEMSEVVGESGGCRASAGCEWASRCSGAGSKGVGSPGSPVDFYSVSLDMYTQPYSLLRRGCRLLWAAQLLQARAPRRLCHPLPRLPVAERSLSLSPQASPHRLLLLSLGPPFLPLLRVPPVQSWLMRQTKVERANLDRFQLNGARPARAPATCEAASTPQPTFELRKMFMLLRSIRVEEREKRALSLVTRCLYAQR